VHVLDQLDSFKYQLILKHLLKLIFVTLLLPTKVKIFSEVNAGFLTKVKHKKKVPSSRPGQVDFLARQGPKQVLCQLNKNILNQDLPSASQIFIAADPKGKLEFKFFVFEP